MFTAETRVSDALAARPELRRILPAFHPSFARLEHPVLGKVLPRLVTVADVARITGVELATLLDVFNLPGPPARALSTPVTAQPVPAAPTSPLPPCAADPLPERPRTDGDDAEVLVQVHRGPDGARLDVRALEAPEPMRHVLLAVADPANLPLTVLHHREPLLLYPRLQERGLSWETRRVPAGVEVHIHAA